MRHVISQDGFLLALSLATLFISTFGAGELDYYDYGGYGGDECQHDNFYCDAQDPAMFHRCLNGVYHSFTCPAGLHFSVKTQACDWPHQADCSSSAQESVQPKQSYDYNSGPELKARLTVSSDNHAHSHGEVSSWISQAAAKGNTWWRPEDVKVSQLKDMQGIKTPAYVEHVADDSSEEEEEVEIKVQPRKNRKSRPASHQQGSRVLDRQRSVDVKWNGGECNPSTCQLPACHCAGTNIPNGLPRASTPQMVMITFDDEVSPSNYGFYQRLFRPGRYNPNGCPVRGTLFVSGSGTIYDLVYPLYAMGMEIASHSMSHRFPHTWWSSASYQDFIEEASGQRENLVSQAGIPYDHISGFRVPFLQLGSDKMYSALYDSKFSYDASMFTGAQWEGPSEPAWPFTLDYVPPEVYCQHGPCPKRQYPGMWEIPVQRWYGLDGHSCAMADGCSATGDDEETLEYLKSNFRRYYNGNRAPMGVFVHARWFETEHNLDGMDKFIDYLLTLDDVYVVTVSQVVEWMKNPTPLSSVHSFEPWSCEGAASEMWKR